MSPSFDALKAEIAARREALSPRLRQLAEYALRNPDDLALETVAVIAERAGVPPSSLIRFANAFGFDGFSAMQRVFRSRLLARSGAYAGGYAERIRSLRDAAGEAAPPAAVLDRLAEAGIAALDRLRGSVRPEQLGQAVDVLAGAEAIHVVGQRRAFPVAAYLAYALGRLGARSYLLDGMGGMILQQTSLIRRRDALVAVTFAPYAQETLAVAHRVDAEGVPIVAVTDGPLSPLVGLARVAFEVEDAELREFRALSATMCLSLALVVQLGQRLAERVPARRRGDRRAAPTEPPPRREDPVPG